MHGLGDHRETLANADVIVRAYDCTHCKTTESVVERSENGIEFGECELCHTKYLPPDWDAMGKEF